MMEDIINKKSHEVSVKIFTSVNELIRSEKYKEITLKDKFSIILDELVVQSTMYAYRIKRNNYFSILPIFEQIEKITDELECNPASAEITMHINSVMKSIEQSYKLVNGVLDNEKA